MPKFVLIDHSIVDVGGHYYEYAVRVLTAAEEAGYEPVLATNRRLGNVGRLPWRVVPVYRNDFFEPKPPRLPATIRRSLDRLCRRAARLKYRLLFSRPALWLAVRCPRTTSVPRRGLEALAIIASAFFFLVRGCLAGARFIRAALPSRPSRRRFPFARRRRWLSWADRKCLLKPQIHALIKQIAFAADSRRLFRHVTLGDGDVVFLPTLAEADMLGLLPLFKSTPTTARATWHLVFRRNIYQGRPPDYAAQDAAQAWRKQAFRRFQSQLSGQRVLFYTDTDALTAQYNRLGVALFRTLPIPVAAEYQEALGDRRWALGQTSLPSRPTPNAQRLTPLLHVVYIGDARTEKGYHLLPHLVSDAIAARLPVRFTIQSNFNVPRGEPAAAVARTQLEAMAAHNVPDTFLQLVTQPLNSDDYRRLLLDADVVVIPYDRDNYFARSSGIFAEALAAGKPVIVPAGTWMAEQLRLQRYLHVGQAFQPDEYHRSCRYLRRLRQAGKPDLRPGDVLLARSVSEGAVYAEPSQLYSCLREVVEHYEHYRSAAVEFSRAWSRYHCPQRLLKELVDAETTAEGALLKSADCGRGRRQRRVWLAADSASYAVAGGAFWL